VNIVIIEEGVIYGLFFFCIWPLKIYPFWHFLYDQIFGMLTLPVIFDGEGPDMKKQVKQIVMTALFMALCCTATMVIHVPSPTQGFVNLGDCMVLLSGWLLGPWYGMAAGVGSAMADVLLSYAHYAPGTLVIKGAMGLLCGLMTARGGSVASRLTSGVLSEIWMVGGYFCYAGLLLGKGWGAAASVPGNVFQGVVCLAAALALYEALDRARALSFLKKERS
jgi:uncharacterized membrane protein